MTKKSGPFGPKPMAHPLHHGQESTIVSENVGAVWLPSTQAPANDNEPSLVWSAGAFLGRHFHWIAPVWILTGLSLLILALTG